MESVFERGTRLKSAPGGEALVDGVDVDVDFFSWFVRLRFALRLCWQSMRGPGGEVQRVILRLLKGFITDHQEPPLHSHVL